VNDILGCGAGPDALVESALFETSASKPLDASAMRHSVPSVNTSFVPPRLRGKPQSKPLDDATQAGHAHPTDAEVEEEDDEMEDFPTASYEPEQDEGTDEESHGSLHSNVDQATDDDMEDLDGQPTVAAEGNEPDNTGELEEDLGGGQQQVFSTNVQSLEMQFGRLGRPPRRLVSH
jgi:hypothetical protein